jgi:CubicO group peptidase (beta-lactamase class C family)
MQQVERGRLLLDDPVTRHLPEFGANGKERITVRHLLTHTSGLDQDWVNQRVQEDPGRAQHWEAQVRTVCEAPLVSAPGTRYAYCNPPFTILAELVRLASGLPIDAYLQAHVFQPLGMVDTAFFAAALPADRIAAVATAGWPEAREPRSATNPLFAPDSRIPRPAGGLYSTAADLVAFGRACLASLDGSGESAATPPLLTPAAMRAMTRSQIEGVTQLVDGAETPAPGRGLGFALPGLPRHDFLSPTAFGHGGATGTQLVVDPDQDLIVVFLTNRLGWQARSRQLAINAAIAAAS